MKLLTVISVNNPNFKVESEDIQVLYANDYSVFSTIDEAQGKYISYVVGNDMIINNYCTEILNKIKKFEFDACFINYEIKNEKKINNKRRQNDKQLDKNIILAYDNIWNYVYKKDLLVKLSKANNEAEFNRLSNELFKIYTSIDSPIYIHYLDNIDTRDLLLSLDKKSEYYNNIIYVGDYCNGIFNGYITWLRNIGKCFANKYKITILYINIPEIILDEMKKYFACVKYENKKNYFCEVLLCTYSTYYYPNNIYHYEDSLLFIHGNMSDYENALKYSDDIYSRYVAVSKESRDKAIGYYPTKKIEYIYNPYKTEAVEGALQLVSAQRSTGVKKIDRIEYMAKLLDELEIPYTWNLFTDTKENTNSNGLIFRNRTPNVLPYIKNSNYLVLLSDSESFSYCAVESLCLNVKVILTPLNAFKELGVKDGENGFIIPFEFFEEKNEELFKEKLREIYLNKDKKIKYIYEKEKFDKYKDIFK